MSKPRYKVAMVAPGPFPAPRGSQVLIRELAEALAEAGHTVHVIAYGAGRAWQPSPRIYVHRTPSFFGGRNAYGPNWQRLLLNVLLLRTLYRVVREYQIDVIHAHNYEAPLLAYVVRSLTGVPVVYHGHNVMSDELGRYFRSRPSRWLATQLGRALDRSVPRHADHVVALSPRMADFLRAQGVPRSQLTVIPPGVAPAGRTGAPALQAGASTPYPEVPVVLYAGNLDPYQDLSMLLQAMVGVCRAEPRALLVIATHATDNWLVKEAGRLGVSDNIRVVVTAEFHEVRRLLIRADGVVCPRTSWSGFPIKLVNYVAAGRAVVAAGGSASARGGGPHGVFDDASPEPFASAII